MSDFIDIIDGTGTGRKLRATEGSDNVHTMAHDIRSLPGQHIDSFSRVRTADPGYRFDSQLTYQIDSDLWDSKVTGTGTVSHNSTERLAVLTAPASGANTAVLQSHYYSPYSPGRGQLAFATFLMGAAPGTDGYKRVGYFDGTNGIYLERTSSAINLVLKSSTAKGTETVAQANWNLDPMDGTGPSGITLDLTKVQILAIQMQALYVGRVVVGFDIDGQLVPVHQFLCANEETGPYIAEASLPVRYEVVAGASTGSDVVLHAICASVISEGGGDLQTIPSRSFVATGTISNASSGVLVVIRPRSTFNSLNNHALVLPTGLDVSVADEGCWVEVRRNVTVDPASTWENVASLSTVETSYAGITGTSPTLAVGGDGTLVDKVWVPAANKATTKDSAGLLGKLVLAYSHLLGTADNIAIVYSGGGSTTDVRASLNWREIR